MANGMRDLAEGRSDVFRIKLENILVREGFNGREIDFNPDDPEDMQLAQSIKATGVLEPLTAFLEEGKAILINGHRRRAATLYAIEFLEADPALVGVLPVRQEKSDLSPAGQVLSMLNRNTGRAFKPLELSRQFARLQGYGLTVEEIAKATGRTRQNVANLIELSSAPEEIKEMVRSGEVSATLASDVIRETAMEEAAAGDTAADQGEAEGEGEGEADGAPAADAPAGDAPADQPPADPLTEAAAQVSAQADAPKPAKAPGKRGKAKAAEVLKEAVSEAKAAGKTKATKKHVKAVKAKRAAKEGKAPPKVIDAVTAVLIRDMITGAKRVSSGGNDVFRMELNEDQMNVFRRLGG